MKCIIFDMGGTLMQYEGMPFTWDSFYYLGFKKIAKSLSQNISNNDIQQSVNIMKSYNPRYNYRENELSPEYIFSQCLRHWSKTSINYNDVIQSFFEGLKLSPIIYPDSIASLQNLKKNFLIASLTDLPTAMPDSLFRKDIASLIEHLDLYVSSQTCGYRKPNKAGIFYIANHFNIPINEILFVGDEPKDFLTAKNAGCKFLLLDRNASICSHKTINSCSALCSRLDC